MCISALGILLGFCLGLFVSLVAGVVEKIMSNWKRYLQAQRKQQRRRRQREMFAHQANSMKATTHFMAEFNDAEAVGEYVQCRCLDEIGEFDVKKLKKVLGEI